MYIVTNLFADLQDNRNVYNPGDLYPREGLQVSPERLEELAGSNNKLGYPLIKLVVMNPPEEEPAEPAKPKKTAAKRTRKKTE